MLARRRFLSRSPFVEKPVEVGSRRWLIVELDRLTSLIVRRRDRRCVTCGEQRALQCSHFHSRRYLSVRFDLRNCNAMCVNYNRRHNSDPTLYLRFINECYGADVVAVLAETKSRLDKATDEELRRTYERYKDMA
jgi:hypothetical protein